MNQIYCPEHLLESTLDALKSAGKSKKERVVLWLAKQNNRQVVVETFEPIQMTTKMLYWLSPDSMRALIKYLKDKKLFIAAQVHSHPGKAFHSETDDNHAIVSHIGALSAVVPFFAKGVTPQNFITKSAFFYLSTSGEWTEASRVQVTDALEIGKI